MTNKQQNAGADSSKPQKHQNQPQSGQASGQQQRQADPNKVGQQDRDNQGSRDQDRRPQH